MLKWITVSCDVCGKTFAARNSTARYCSEDCRRMYEKKRKRLSEIKHKVKERARSSAAAIGEVINSAAAQGLSYGEYVARKHREEADK